MNILIVLFCDAWQTSIEDEKQRQDRIAKMRSLLFRHEMKAKHIKKIKSKTYHRLLKKDRIKAISAQIDVDPEAAKEFNLKQERLRVEVFHCFLKIPMLSLDIDPSLLTWCHFPLYLLLLINFRKEVSDTTNHFPSCSRNA